ncbi:MAG: L,D-transpeptidase [Candidatus Paceibacterota bacterium]
MSGKNVIYVRQNTEMISKASFLFNEKEYLCSIGAAGIKKDKIEGDLSTPIGTFQLRCLFYRPDRLERPNTGLKAIATEIDDAWCDDPSDSAYNTHVKLPRKGSYENLWIEDSIYDIIIPIGYNDDPPIPGKGSAIFIHIAHKEMTPTCGCVALEIKDLIEIIKDIDQNTKIKIEE